jgi:hypothetical protein
MTTRCLITLSEGCWWRMPASPTTLGVAERLQGVAIIADVDETARTARLVHTIRGDGPARLAQWCRVHRFRSLTPVPDAAPEPAAVTARPSITA